MSLSLTPAKAAILLGTSDRTVRSMIQRRILRATAVGSRMGTNGPARYEISLEDLQATGLPLHFARLPLIAATAYESKGTEQEGATHASVTALLQTLKEEHARLQALRAELEGTLHEWRNRCVRMDDWETRRARVITQTSREVRTRRATQGGATSHAPSLIEGSPSGLTPLWIENFSARIRYNTSQHVLVIDNSIVALSPTEYQLVFAILTQYAEWQSTRQAGCFVVMQAMLQHVVGKASPRLIARHLANANAKLAPFGLRVQLVVGSGYTLVVDSPVTPRRRPFSTRQTG